MPAFQQIMSEFTKN